MVYCAFCLEKKPLSCFQKTRHEYNEGFLGLDFLVLIQKNFIQPTVKDCEAFVWLSGCINTQPRPRKVFKYPDCTAPCVFRNQLFQGSTGDLLKGLISVASQCILIFQWQFKSPM